MWRGRTEYTNTKSGIRGFKSCGVSKEKRIVCDINKNILKQLDITI